MMEGLKNSQEQNLILELTDRFLKVEFEEYDKYLLYSVKNLFQDVPNNTIRVVPMLAPEDIGKVKSSISVAYRFKGDKLKTLSEYNGQNLIVHDNVSSLPKKIDDEDIILIVDDFIGTGETARNAVKHLLEVNSSVTISKVFLLSLVSLKTGVDLIESMGIRLYSTVVLERGISDYYNQPEKGSYLSLISDIESRIGVFNKFKLGYGKSEALVSMIRTPNNTLPVFWLDNEIALSPFPR